MQTVYAGNVALKYGKPSDIMVAEPQTVKKRSGRRIPREKQAQEAAKQEKTESPVKSTQTEKAVVPF